MTGKSNFFLDNPRIREAMGEAIRDDVVQHKLLGQSIVIWRDGKVVWVPAEEIEVPAEKPTNGQQDRA